MNPNNRYFVGAASHAKFGAASHTASASASTPTLPPAVAVSIVSAKVPMSSTTKILIGIGVVAGILYFMSQK